MESPEAPVKSESTNKSKGYAMPAIEGIVWWTMLMVAVLAIPAISIMVSMALPLSDFARVVSFIVTCWACTWAGMWLMRRSDLKDFEKKQQENKS